MLRSDLRGFSEAVADSPQRKAGASPRHRQGLSAAPTGERCAAPRTHLGERRELERELLPGTQHPIFIQKGGCRFNSSPNPSFDVTTCAGRYKRKEGDLENASCLSRGLVRLLKLTTAALLRKIPAALLCSLHYQFFSHATDTHQNSFL